jgi:hypothetical protein
VFKNIQKQHARDFGDWLRTKISAAGAGPVSSSSSGPRDIASEIERFADLNRRGMLTDEEFAAKKKQLLGL